MDSCSQQAVAWLRQRSGIMNAAQKCLETKVRLPRMTRYMSDISWREQYKFCGMVHLQSYKQALGAQRFHGSLYPHGSSLSATENCIGPIIVIVG
jgi:hypothetical protein